ncbi:hypothetical protein H5410_007964 [Solanum commersonii]|uniref:non-specific serine/threonine protein kinase n=1 Tax=Solanum commersonii TaxID=4109 RepID=A0A9J6AF50_SOLCO|nr:hypothetical protein H5410_007964 [Solanum commersonii]
MATGFRFPPFWFLFLFILSCFSSFCLGSDRVTRGKIYKDGDNITSKGGDFVLGFFSPANTSKRYLGIWYVDVPVKTYIWVANRNNPVHDKNGTFSIGENGNLVVKDGHGDLLWSSNVSVNTTNSTACLRDEGNLVILNNDRNATRLNSELWESFSDPTDTFLPGMELLIERQGQEQKVFRSWTNESDPSPGRYSMGVDPRGTPQIVIWDGPNRRWRSGHFDGAEFIGVPDVIRTTFFSGFRIQNEGDNKLLLTYSASNTSSFVRFQLTVTGNELQQRWNEDQGEWNTLQSRPVGGCDLYNFCGNFAECDKDVCQCLKGFVPRVQEQWHAGNRTEGCVRKTELECRRNSSVSRNDSSKDDGFSTIRRVKLPDHADVSEITTDECKIRCLNDCSCNAYAYVRGINCMIWRNDLVDIEHFQEGGNTLYVRLHPSDIGKRKKTIIIVVISILAALALVVMVAIWLVCKYRARRRESKRTSEIPKNHLVRSGEFSTEYSGPGDISAEGHQGNGSELAFFSFSMVATATDDFSLANKLGQGGFGPVYKGKLPCGQEVAVKRLSQKSGQGDEEFKNEITLIAKLQHRNLVRLLGCCVEGEEKMLIYEYMPNKSLDTFLFDTARKSQLISKFLAPGAKSISFCTLLLNNSGYMAPEYAMEGLFSGKSDVYSFGIILLEIICGRRNTSFRTDEHSGIIGYAWEKWDEGRPMDLVDRSIWDGCQHNEALRCIHLALLCVQDLAAHRPNMSSVVLMLETDNVRLPLPRQPTYTSMRRSVDEDIWHGNQDLTSSNNVTKMGFRQAWKILLISLISCCIIQSYHCNASDTIQQSWKLLVGETLTSASQVFEFGFFTPANSDKRYLGIWFKNIPPIKVVWVANRESPLKVSDSTVSLSISEYGNLVLLDGTQNVIWSSNVSVPTNNTVAVVLLDSGNLVLKDNVSGQSFWESFDYPCDTFLPGMKIGFNSITREKWLLSSWQKENDPSLGNFSIGISEQLSPQFFIWNKVTPYYRTGEWNGLKFIGLPCIDSAAYIIQFVFQQDYQEGTTYFTFLPNTSFLTFVELQSTGSVQVVQWTSGAPAWEIYATMVHAPCDIYNTCGPSAVCSKHNFPTCSCLRGFVPHSSDEWNKGNWTGGCVRQTELLCQQKGNSLSPGVGLQDGFFKLSGLKLPDLAAIFRLDSASECEKLCLNNCSCTAYAYVAGIRCMVWSGDLLDMQDYSYSGEDLFLRLAYSELGKRKRKRALIICSAVFSCLSLGFALFCLLKHKIYITGQKRKVARSFSLGDSCYISKDYTVESLWVGNLKKEDPIELPLIEFEVIVTATNNFKVENKLGEGGFGPVFKGKLKDGPEIAVKRLSNRTGQGIEEFKNEIVLISKLQHRNLVRLLGCCIEGEELLIIYEYMPNRSLDKSLFDASQKELLDWPKRFNIIQGVSNILLDEEMNPKISDFGLARTFQKQQQLVHTHRVAGTYGYMSPEYALRGVFSEKSDVFSFGVLLLEIISGKKNSSFHYVEENLNLLNYAWKLWSEQRGLDFIDGTLINSFSPEEITRCLHAGLLCVQEHPRDRPTMADIILMLNSEMKCSSPKQPTFKFETYLDLGGSVKDNERCSVNEFKCIVVSRTIEHVNVHSKSC